MLGWSGERERCEGTESGCPSTKFVMQKWLQVNHKYARWSVRETGIAVMLESEGGIVTERARKKRTRILKVDELNEKFVTCMLSLWFGGFGNWRKDGERERRGKKKKG